MRRNSYTDAFDHELKSWPGVTARDVKNAKHRAYIVGFGGKERKVFFPDTPGDNIKGPLNGVTKLRHILRELGAVKA